MIDFLEKRVVAVTGAESVARVEVIQELWSGYGQILRCYLSGGNLDSVVVKNVRLPDMGGHPRGWNTINSHDRKVESYRVEVEWYERWSKCCCSSCRVPECMAVEHSGDEVLMVLEDLDGAGYPSRCNKVGMAEVRSCLRWLANFHATFLNKEPSGLWPVGTYWHLDTRPDELDVLSDKELKSAAGHIDHMLSGATYKTFVHGDAKLANFCFSEDGGAVAAVDFQYVGGGCGMKDVVYFLGSCFYEQECERQEKEVLDFYFEELRGALIQKGSEINCDLLEREWRDLYPVAWTDFHRFIKGWSPGHWKVNSYSERMSRDVIDKLRGMDAP